MIKIYEKLKFIAETEYKDIVISTNILGQRTIGSAKLRIFFKDHSFLDIWHIKTHPQHLHNGHEKNIKPSYIDTNPTGLSLTSEKAWLI